MVIIGSIFSHHVIYWIVKTDLFHNCLTLIIDSNYFAVIENVFSSLFAIGKARPFIVCPNPKILHYDRIYLDGYFNHGKIT